MTFSQYFNDHLSNKTTLNYRIPPSANRIWFVPNKYLKKTNKQTNKHRQKTITRGINALIFACLCMLSTSLKLINLWQMDVTRKPVLTHLGSWLWKTKTCSKYSGDIQHLSFINTSTLTLHKSLQIFVLFAIWSSPGITTPPGHGHVTNLRLHLWKVKGLCCWKTLQWYIKITVERIHY